MSMACDTTRHARGTMQGVIDEAMAGKLLSYQKDDDEMLSLKEIEESRFTERTPYPKGRYEN